MSDDPHFLDEHIACSAIGAPIKAVLTSWRDRDPVDALSDASTLRDILGPKRPLAYIVLADPAASLALKDAIRSWLDRDPQLAQADALQLFRIVTLWADAALAQLILLDRSSQAALPCQ